VVPSGKGKHTVTALNPHTGNKQKPPYVTGVAFAHRIRNTGDPKARVEDILCKYQTTTVKNFQWAKLSTARPEIHLYL
jgi:hypothetical protein